MRLVDDGAQSIQRKVVLEWVTQDTIVPLGDDGCGPVHASDGRWQESIVLQSVLGAAHCSVSDHLLHLVPCLRIQMVALALESLFDFLARVDPGAFQVAQYRLEVLTVVSPRVVLLLPSLEPLAHLGDLHVDSLLSEDGRGDSRKGNVLHEVIRLARLTRHTQSVVVVSRPSNRIVTQPR